MSTKDTKVQEAEEVKNEQNTPEVETPETSKEEEKEELLKKEDVNKIVQERLAKERKKFDDQIKKEREEAERMATLSAEEKQRELESKKKEEVEGRERELSIRENTLTARERLREAGVAESFASYAVDQDPEKTQENIDKIIEDVKSQVTSAVQEKLKGQPPKDISSDSKPKRETVTAF